MDKSTWPGDSWDEAEPLVQRAVGVYAFVRSNECSVDEFVNTSSICGHCGEPSKDHVRTFVGTRRCWVELEWDS